MLVTAAVLPAVVFQAYSEHENRQTRQQLMEDEALRLVQQAAAEQQRIWMGRTSC